MQLSKISELACRESKAPSVGLDLPSSEYTFLHYSQKTKGIRHQHVVKLILILPPPILLHKPHISYE